MRVRKKKHGSERLAAAGDLLCTDKTVTLADPIAPTGSGLTLREREVLAWTADGKTAYEIGMIFGIAERTVKFHLQNAVVKLDAMNKTHAATKAAMLGLLP